MQSAKMAHSSADPMRAPGKWDENAGSSGTAFDNVARFPRSAIGDDGLAAPWGSRRPELDRLRVNGCAPFVSPANAADQCVDDAHALLLLIGSAMSDAEVIGEGVEHEGMMCPSSFGTLRQEIKARAIAGVANLLAVAVHLRDLAEHDQARGRPA